MKLQKIRKLTLAFVFLTGFALGCHHAVFAESEESSGESSTANVLSGTNISISPVSETIRLYSNSVYDRTFTVANNGDNDMEVEVYASPYAYTYSEEQDAYQLGFSHENSFTQIVRWISFQDLGGSYVENPHFTIAPGSKLEIPYRISTPDNIPAGGQYAVIFVHTISGPDTAHSNGVVTEAAPGIIVYGRSMEGEINSTIEISDLKIGKLDTQKDESSDSIKSGYTASAKVKNIGNIDITASGSLVVSSIFGKKIYETNGSGNSIISVIPESERDITDTWSKLPNFGIYKATWTVTAGENTQSISRLIFINFAPVVIIGILVLTAVIFWIIIRARKRKERRSRFAM